MVGTAGNGLKSAVLLDHAQVGPVHRLGRLQVGRGDIGLDQRVGQRRVDQGRFQRRAVFLRLAGSCFQLVAVRSLQAPARARRHWFFLVGARLSVEFFLERVELAALAFALLLLLAVGVFQRRDGRMTGDVAVNIQHETAVLGFAVEVVVRRLDIVERRDNGR